jgi:hypothetical protein
MERDNFSKSRREFLTICSAAGVGSTFFAGSLLALAAEKPEEKITAEMIKQAAALAGVDIKADRVAALVAKLNEQRRAYGAIRRLHLPNDVPPAFRFDPVISGQIAPSSESAPIRIAAAPGLAPSIIESDIPKDLEKLAFATIRELGALIQNKKVSVVQLTEMYLGRLKRFDSRLHFLVTLTEERARAQAIELDAEIGRGQYRGPLHGIPWGAKDLLAVRGYPTTWGAGGFQEQAFNEESSSDSMKQARSSSQSSLWARWRWATNGSADGRGIRGTPAKVPAVHRRDQLRQLLVAASHLPSVLRH